MCTVKSGTLLQRNTDSSFKKKCFVWGFFTRRKLKILVRSYLTCNERSDVCRSSSLDPHSRRSEAQLLLPLIAPLDDEGDDGGLEYLTLFAERAV